MPKEVATKNTSGFTPTPKNFGVGARYKCTHCGDEIYWNTHKKMIMCKCGALGVDWCEFYVRLIGNEADREEIKKERKL